MLIKRIFDFCCAVAGLVLLSPSFAIIALLIKLESSGPVFFRQERVGRNGIVFRVFKFRTMVVGAEKSGELTIGHDVRITRIGYLLRHYKIDEFPQLLNVLRGEMSLVGPRPEVPRYVAMYPKEMRKIILSVMPGITDLASIRFKDESEILGCAKDPEYSYAHEILPVKVNYYVQYVLNRSFLLDLKIIFLTLFAVLLPLQQANPKET